MAKITTYRIYQGPDVHVWRTSDPPSPVGRYQVVKFVIVNGEIWEEPTEYQKISLLPEEYSSHKEASDVSWKLNEEWFLTDPQWELYNNKTKR